jgi:hypothetical protein
MAADPLRARTLVEMQFEALARAVPALPVDRAGEARSRRRRRLLEPAAVALSLDRDDLGCTTRSMSAVVQAAFGKMVGHSWNAKVAVRRRLRRW